MSGSSKRPDWLDPDPTAGMGPCSACGREYVLAGGLCRDCIYSKHLERLRELYPRHEAEVRALVEFEYYERRVQAMVLNERALPLTYVEVHRVRSISDPSYFADKVLQIWQATATTGDGIETWFVVGPDPWEMFPAVQIGGAEGALIYYRMTQRYDAEGWRLDPTTGKRGDKP